ncbi:SCP2 sterol-binding domain-containing protein [Uliginosibacterium sp. H3]|uniref:SCP2 sterol-binding domain-containing protein n=1 Tax=Uliginosibacterium silvisoli TaxID=3114758 RepID=A0ABU6K0L0_9RHOO|nr:SCP2 sterol-binding domain-containing protein [Uliginosibacterium sp. H3]
MLQAFLLGPLNRLLKGEAWASDMLKPHAGKSAELSLGGVTLRMRVTDAGQVDALAGDAVPDVRIALPASALVSLQDGPDQLSKLATISGDAGFAETISVLLKHLRPDVGAALSPLMGDVLAARVESGLARANAGARQLARNLGANVVEYVRDEQGLVVQQDELAAWRGEMAAAQENLARLEARVARLGS